jgi:hypothetical protein
VTALDKAIRAAQVADAHFLLARRPRIAGEAGSMALQGEPATALFVYAHARVTPSEVIPQWHATTPEERSAWEIFRATMRILDAVEREENLRRRNVVRMPVPSWMFEDGIEEQLPGMNDRVSYGQPRRAAAPPSPQTPQTSPALPPLRAQQSEPKTPGGRKKG